MPVATPTRSTVSNLQAGQPLASLRGVGKVYTTPAGSFTALADVDLDIAAALS